MEKIFSHAWADKHGESENVQSKVEPNAQNVVKDGEGLKRKNPVDTTLLIHFFGKKGSTTLKYEDFRRYFFAFVIRFEIMLEFSLILFYNNINY